jgi:hypothetical protein
MLNHPERLRNLSASDSSFGENDIAFSAAGEHQQSSARINAIGAARSGTGDKTTFVPHLAGFSARQFSNEGGAA